MQFTGPESFPCLADLIFGELEGMSMIRIDSFGEEGTLDEWQNIGFRIRVNGLASPLHYLHYMRALKSGILQKLESALSCIAPGERAVFMQQVRRRIGRINASATIDDGPGSKARGRQRVSWVQERVHFFHNGHENPDPVIRESALVLSSRYALIYHLVTKRLEASVRFCENNRNLFSTSLPSHFKKNYRSPIRLSFSVPLFGALLRVMSDRQVFEARNVAEFCRKLVSIVDSSERRRLGLRSFRIAYDDPLPETLEKLLEELKIWVRYTEKFIERQRR
ncbi:MAG: hypothetical protein NTW10_00340 [Bacteroidetes bacterium]|nr:hypothetical protein [Bacteroidota bacterium]